MDATFHDPKLPLISVLARRIILLAPKKVQIWSQILLPVSVEQLMVRLCDKHQDILTVAGSPQEEGKKAARNIETPLFRAQPSIGETKGVIGFIVRSHFT